VAVSRALAARRRQVYQMVRRTTKPPMPQ